MIMTCVAVKKWSKWIHLCADTEISYWWYWKDKINWKHLKNKSKIYSVNWLHFGWAGDVWDLMWFKEFCKTNIPKWSRLDDIESFLIKFYADCKEKDWNYSTDNTDYILIYKSNVFLIQWYNIFEIDEYATIWSWWEYARTALHLWKNAKEAVEIAIDLAEWVWWDVTEILIDIT